MIIGITGTIGAGKGTVVEYLKSKGFKHYSSSGLLTDILKERGEVVDRDGMARIGRELRAKDPNGVPKLTYEKIKKDNPKDAILEALHTVGEAEFVRSVGGFILGVDADLRIRYDRISKRGSSKDHVTFEKFAEQAKREDDGTEESGHNIRGVLKIADAVVTNNGTQEDLFAQVEQALEK
ncbi:MAG: AAA family ATPase [Patescibacteria group bacterium]